MGQRRIKLSCCCFFKARFHVSEGSRGVCPSKHTVDCEPQSRKPPLLCNSLQHLTAVTSCRQEPTAARPSSSSTTSFLKVLQQLTLLLLVPSGYKVLKVHIFLVFSLYTLIHFSHWPLLAPIVVWTSLSSVSFQHVMFSHNEKCTVKVAISNLVSVFVPSCQFPLLLLTRPT